MKSLIAFVVALAVVGLSSGCSTWGYKMATGSQTYQPVPASHVEILFAPPTARKYEQIGIVSVLGAMYAPDMDMLKKLRKSAADLGADAVILQAENLETASAYSYPKNRGIAIKYLP